MADERFFITYFQDRSFLVFDANDDHLAKEYADFRAGQIGTKVVRLTEITGGEAEKLGVNNGQEAANGSRL
jgi:hypothetical protein